MSVSHLAQLLESGQYERCLKEAAVLLADGGQDAEGRARIQQAICRSQLALTDYFAAVESGRKVVDLAEEAAVPDLLGFALVDLGTALTLIHRHEEAQKILIRFLAELPTYTAARCREGIALLRLADALQGHGQHQEALERYRQARAWFTHYGDECSARKCVRAMIRFHLDRGEPERVAPLLQEGDRYVTAHPTDQEAWSDHLLDRSLFHLTIGEHTASSQEAFQALETAGDRLDQQSRAHLVLCQNALAQNTPREALSFAIAARVSAIDGRFYDLEFEAADLLFRLLRDGGVQLLSEVSVDYRQYGVDIYHYLSERVLRRMGQSN